MCVIVAGHKMLPSTNCCHRRHKVVSGAHTTPANCSTVDAQAIARRIHVKTPRCRTMNARTPHAVLVAACIALISIGGAARMPTVSGTTSTTLSTARALNESAAQTTTVSATSTTTSSATNASASAPTTTYTILNDALAFGGIITSTLLENSTTSSGNELWDNLAKECMAKPTYSCFQRNVYHYLDGTLRLGDVNVTNSFRFVRNTLDEESLRKNSDEDDDEDAEDESRGSASPLEEVTDALSGKGVNFLMTHNVELNMPEMLFDGATVRISPRSFEGNGALLHFEIVPAATKQLQDAGRLLFKPLKKLKKLFRSKLLLSFLAIVLIVKLIKVKIFWILPFIVGVGTAKKLMLKFVLFLFPALASVFKLCSVYHKNFHDGTKYHHHKHQINHLHSVVPAWLSEPSHDDSGSNGPYGAHEPELIYTSPPKGHPSEYLHGGPPQYQPHAQDWETYGPPLGSEFIIDRNTNVQSFKSKLDELNEISSLGGGVVGTTTRTRPHPAFVHPAAGAAVAAQAAPLTQSGSPVQPFGPYAKSPANRIVTTSQYHRQVITPKHVAPQRPQPAQSAPVSQYATVTDEKMLREAQRLQSAQLEALRIQAEQKQQRLQQQQLQQQQHQLIQQTQTQPFAYNPDDTPAAPVIDRVYGPILQKIDKIMLQLTFTDEPCKERLICSMYKAPLKYSPHSNFISAELSRDLSELPKPTTSNADVVRFFRYVQAARDGQDQRDCLQIYGQCTINTEK